MSASIKLLFRKYFSKFFFTVIFAYATIIIMGEWMDVQMVQWMGAWNEKSVKRVQIPVEFLTVPFRFEKVWITQAMG